MRFLPVSGAQNPHGKAPDAFIIGFPPNPCQESGGQGAGGCPQIAGKLSTGGDYSMAFLAACAISAVAWLESLGLIRKEVRKNPCGDNTSNLYTIVAAPPIAAPPSHAEDVPADALHFLVVYAGIDRASCKSECRDLRIRCSRLRIAPSLTPSCRAIPVRGSPSQ